MLMADTEKVPMMSGSIPGLKAVIVRDRGSGRIFSIPWSARGACSTLAQDMVASIIAEVWTISPPCVVAELHAALQESDETNRANSAETCK